ncbi:MAG TPA: HNH endonuclease signature motif containing protein [Nocardioidaceae bacterium]|nr:HNH endonuclease signature motif containing protein [Nocardioidaceae bacterium]
MRSRSRSCRAKAVGNIARRDLGINNPETAAQRTELVVHVAPGSKVAREQKTGAPISIESLREGLDNPFMNVVVKPVVDLAEHIHVAQYEVPDRLAFQVDSRDQTCAFPWCQRPARRCDHDHVIPFAQGGTTCSRNVVPACRRHHRLKTHHGNWIVTVLEPGTFLWQSPHGYQFLRDNNGTRDVSRDGPPDRAGP